MKTLRIITFMGVSLFLAANSQLILAGTEPTSEQLISRLESNIATRLSEIAQVSIAEGKVFDEIALFVKQSNDNSTKLGMVVDTAKIASNGGYKILSVSPNSVAELAGLKAGFVITKIDDIEATDDNRNNAISKLISKPDSISSIVEFRENRNANIRQVQLVTKPPKFILKVGLLAELEQESFDNKDLTDTSVSNMCGLVSLLQHPPTVKDIYEVSFYKINGEKLIRSKTHFKLSPGKHTIEVHEQIVDRSFNRIGLKIKKEPKTLEIDVKANEQYYIAAKFYREKRYSDEFSEGYWEPVIWKIIERDCDQ